MVRVWKGRAVLRCVVAVAGLAALTAAPLAGAAAVDSATGAATRATLGSGSPAGPAATPPAKRWDVDVRRPADATARQRAESRAQQLKARPAVTRLRTSLGAQAVVDIDPFTGTPRQVAKLDGLLTTATTAPARDVALGYVRSHADAFGLDAADIAGLRLAKDYVDIQDTHHLSFTQSADGVPLFGNGLKANVTSAGRLVNLTGSPVHGLDVNAPARAAVSAAQAIGAARLTAGEATAAPGPRDTATAVLFQTAGGARRAWQVVTMSGQRPALTVVDAADSAILYRDLLGADLQTVAPTPYSADVVESHPGAGVGGTAHTVSLSGNGWLAAGATALAGNNVHTFTDIDGDGTLASTEEVRPTGPSGYRFALHRTNPTGQGNCTTTVCTWVPDTPYSWRANSNASRTAAQNFYFINRWHDYLQAAPIGFTEAAGNFQKVNATGLGKGADAVVDEALSGAAILGGSPSSEFIDNADFDTPPDGQSPTMRMFLFHEPGTTAAQDEFAPVAGSDSADIVYHEYTHGLSHRLVVDASNNPALDSLQGSSMGEAWSDWYGLDYLVNHSATTGMTDGAGPDVVEGRYVLGPTTTTGIRSMPIDCPVGSGVAACTGITGTGGGGYTYADVKTIWNRTGGDVHAAGEVWGQALWDLRTTLIAALGQGPGSQLAESLVTRGMELSPTYPSMLDMRNAIIAADLADYAGAHVDTLWPVFAARGLGFFASSQGGDDMAPVESFAVPPASGSPTGTLSGTVTNTVGGGPLAGVTIGISGHDSGFPGDYVATTDSQGHYSMAGLVLGTYPSVYASGGVDRVKRVVSISAGSNVQNWTVARDWVSASGGARVVDFTGIDLTSRSCGPGNAIDQSPELGWASSITSGAPSLTVKVPAYVDISTFAINPANICGDGRAAALKSYRLQTSVDGVTWLTAATGTFGTANNGHLNPVTPTAGTSTVHWVRLVMLAPQVSGQSFVDVAELEVYGSLSPGPPPHNHQGGRPPIPRGVAR